MTRDKFNCYIDAEAIEYTLNNIKNAKRTGVISQMEKYADLADKATDPWKRVYFEYRMYLPAEQALNLADTYYARERRNNVLLGLDFGNEGEEGDLTSALNFKQEYGNNAIDKGVFELISKAQKKTPERIIEVADLFDKLLNESQLSDVAKIVLITRLMMGTGPQGSGRSSSSRSDNQSLDVSTILSKLPEEYSIVIDQVHTIQKEGIKHENITTTMILSGFTIPADESKTGEPIKIKGLLAKWEITEGTKELKQALYKLAGTDDMDELKILFHVNESIPDDDEDIEEAKSDKARMKAVSKTLKAVMKRGSVKKSEFITAVVTAVALNIKKKTPLVKSKLFASKNVREISKAYFKLAMKATKGNKGASFDLQDLFLAPVLMDNKNILPLKK